MTDREKARRLAREADRICRMILSTELPGVDILVAVERLRELCEEWFPGSEELFEMIYVSRFERLREQFGDDLPGPADEDFAASDS